MGNIGGAFEKVVLAVQDNCGEIMEMWHEGRFEETANPEVVFEKADNLIVKLKKEYIDKKGVDGTTPWRSTSQIMIRNLILIKERYRLSVNSNTPISKLLHDNLRLNFAEFGEHPLYREYSTLERISTPPIYNILGSSLWYHILSLPDHTIVRKDPITGRVRHSQEAGVLLNCLSQLQYLGVPINITEKPFSDLLHKGSTLESQFSFGFYTIPKNFLTITKANAIRDKLIRAINCLAQFISIDINTPNSFHFGDGLKIKDFIPLIDTWNELIRELDFKEADFVSHTIQKNSGIPTIISDRGSKIAYLKGRHSARIHRPFVRHFDTIQEDLSIIDKWLYACGIRDADTIHAQAA